MSKRKTKQQKKIAQLRRKLSSQITLSSASGLSNPVKKQQNKNQEKTSFYSFSSDLKNKTYTNSQSFNPQFLQADLRKTVILTGSIVVLELLLFFLLKNNLLPVSL